MHLSEIRKAHFEESSGNVYSSGISEEIKPDTSYSLVLLMQNKAIYKTWLQISQHTHVHCAAEERGGARVPRGQSVSRWQKEKDGTFQLLFLYHVSYKAQLVLIYTFPFLSTDTILSNLQVWKLVFVKSSAGFVLLNCYTFKFSFPDFLLAVCTVE